jgi:glutamate N-acetyltransferase/amino-acid N-acetyltransferase
MGMADAFSLDDRPVRLSDVAGIRTGAAACGLKPEGHDVGVLLCESTDGAGTAVFTQNAVRAAPVRVSTSAAESGLLRAAVVNAGIANCLTGEDGVRDARDMVSLAASGLGVPAGLVLVASCGEAGRLLPMEKVRRGIEQACRDARNGGRGDFASTVAPAGTAPRIISASGTIDSKRFRMAAAAKGGRAEADDMAAMFAFVATDAAVSPECLREVLPTVHGRTFERLSADAGASTNDTLCVLCSGRAGNDPIDNMFLAGAFSEALEAIVTELVADVSGEADATRVIEVRVSGAASERDAKLALPRDRRVPCGEDGARNDGPQLGDGADGDGTVRGAPGRFAGLGASWRHCRVRARTAR